MASRRDLLKFLSSAACSTFVDSTLANSPLGSHGGGSKPDLLFSGTASEKDWQQFSAEGYPQPVTGVIYRMGTPGSAMKPFSGVPMGGVDTGGLYLDPNGLLGLSSIFNNYVPPGGPLNSPYLGVSIGERDQTWVLTTGFTKNYVGPTNRPSLGPDLMFSWGGPNTAGIDYWGHYPIVDQRFQISGPLGVALRSWSPFIPGDAVESNIPGTMFEVHLRNDGLSILEGSLAFSFPGFAKHRTRNEILGWPQLARDPELPNPHVERKELSGNANGVVVTASEWEMSYVLAALNEAAIRTGGELATDGIKWGQIKSELPCLCPDSGGTSLAVDFHLSPGEQRVVRFLLAWYAPEWEGNGEPGTGGRQLHTWMPAAGLPPDAFGTTGKRFSHMYAKRFRNATEVAEYLVNHHRTILDRIIRWQSVLYDSKSIPGWLADSLINSLYYFAPSSVWAQAKPPIGSWCSEKDGLFAISESTRSAAQMSTLPNLAIGGPLLTWIFPELALSSLRALKAYQDNNGDLPVVIGDWMDPASPKDYRYQEVLNAADYMIQLHRHWKVTGSDSFIDEFYSSGKKAMSYAFSQRPDLGSEQIIAMPPHEGKAWDDKDWFEDRPLKGLVSHAGGIRIAAAEMIREWAVVKNDEAFVKQLDLLIKAGHDALQKYLWRRDHYLVFFDPSTGDSLDAFFSPQLNGQYFAQMHGLAPVFPSENLTAVLGLIKKVCAISKLGMPPDYAEPDGRPWLSEQGNGYLIGEFNYCNFEIYMIASLFIFQGDREFGMNLLRKNLEIIAFKWGYIWDGGCCNSGAGDDGNVSSGWDYFFNWTIWGVLAALAGGDVRVPSSQGGIVAKMINAGRGTEYA
jgi:uncharacterized protein (DUF608 family)